jgi:inner membrane transporter RhtA
MPPRDWLLVAAYGAVLGAMNLSFYLALRTIPLGLAIAIEFTGPRAVAVFSSRKAADLVWVGLAALGLALLLPGGFGRAALDPVGVACASAAAVFWALYIVLGKRTAHLPAGPTVALGVAVAALVVTPVGVVAAGRRLLEPSIVAMGLGVAVLSSALPYSLEMIALRGLSKRTFGILVSLEPAVGALAGFAFLGEVLHPSQWLSIAAVMAASVGTVWSSRVQARSELLAT